MKDEKEQIEEDNDLEYYNIGRWGTINVTKFIQNGRTSFSFQKSWRNQNGEWNHRSMSFFQGELDNLRQAVNKALLCKE